jgi:hypothetical protein
VFNQINTPINSSNTTAVGNCQKFETPLLLYVADLGAHTVTSAKCFNRAASLSTDSAILARCPAGVLMALANSASSSAIEAPTGKETAADDEPEAAWRSAG